MILKKKEDVNFSNFQINTNLDKNLAVQIKDVSFKYLGSNQAMFNNINIEFKRAYNNYRPKWIWESTLLGLVSGVFYPNKGVVTSISINLIWVLLQ